MCTTEPRDESREEDKVGFPLQTEQGAQASPLGTGQGQAGASPRAGGGAGGWGWALQSGGL